MTQVAVVVGTQWGDEGKGKIVDLYAEEADVIVRFQGGDNAGHTLVVKGIQTILHLIPSGILHNHKTCILGNGMVINPEVLIGEIDQLQENGLFPPDTTLHVSTNAHIIMPYHRRLDMARERRLGTSRIGTTAKGIGPAYEDKAARTGIRFGDLLDDTLFREKLERNVEEKNFFLTEYFKEDPVDIDAIHEEYRVYADRLRQYAGNASLLIKQEAEKGKRILFEGAQGCHLDIDHGTYPFVTSSSTVSGSACSGAGIGPGKIGAVVGICKAYTTRVGGGPFVTELEDETGERIQRVGKEFGATTGRKRRCGWLDMVMVRQSVRLSGVTAFAMTKLDVLTGLDTLRICTGYRTDDDEFIEEVPTNLETLQRCRPVYEDMDGWMEDISAARRMSDLPRNTRKYIEKVESLSGVDVILVSVGPGREETIITAGPF